MTGPDCTRTKSGFPSPGGWVVLLICRHFFCSWYWVSISRIIPELTESPRSSAAFWRSRRCWQRNAGASFANSDSLQCAISICIITSLWEIYQGLHRWAWKQSLMRLQGSGGPSPMTNTLTCARSHHRDSQKPTSGLHSMWHILNFVHAVSKWSLNWTSSLSQLFIRYRKLSSEKQSMCE